MSYFPHLIAGPIIHHKEIMPQLRNASVYTFNSADALLGITIFTIGLSKKMLLAGFLSTPANALFDAAKNGVRLSFGEAWTAALLYAFQIYFDFSGYCDMAIGLSVIMGIRLPVNFASPYKAINIIAFWRQWHMTLSRFLRDYLYIPLGGNRLGSARRHLNLMITMALGGLWHGAAWTFLIWGLLHGSFLLVNHAWRAVKRRPAIAPAVSGAITFIVVTFAWVFFRASDLPSAIGMAKAMLAPDFGVAFSHDLIDRTALGFLAGCAALVWLFPNTQEITRKWRPALEGDVRAQTAFIPLRWSPAGVTSLVTAVLLAACIMSLSNVGDFIYFKF